MKFVYVIWYVCSNGKMENSRGYGCAESIFRISLDTICLDFSSVATVMGELGWFTA